MAKSTVLNRAASGRDWFLMFLTLPVVLAGCGGGGNGGTGMSAPPPAASTPPMTTTPTTPTTPSTPTTPTVPGPGGPTTPAPSPPIQSAGYWHTSGSKIVDSSNTTVRITGVNWYGFETTDHLAHGLWAQD
ncbi:MAG TPA: hypothetical protein VI653_01225, partial [Steroidobacteraceae bacterium]